ncbi:MAG: DUF4340 domain-containing protein [Actinobacteria bacterium]|nr:MAG: DUF4340 domain-containing protein [Actinomycetota bacterium]
MSNRQLQILAGVLVLLAAALVLARWNASRPQSAFNPPFEPGSLDRNSVDKVLVSGPGQTLTLQRKGKTWSVDGSEADTETVNNFWKAVSKSRFEEVISTNPANYESFGVDKGARSIAFFEGKERKAELLLGNPAEMSAAFYVRAQDGKEVWMMSGDLSEAVSVPAGEWKAKPAKTEEPAKTTPPPAAPGQK